MLEQKGEDMSKLDATGIQENLTPEDVYNMFPAFYGNPMIQDLAGKPYWTISDNSKKPIDMGALRVEQKLVGCLNYEDSTVTIRELLELIPNASNHAYRLDSDRDGYVCLDIEPSCPENIKKKLLQLNYVYGETSLSGKGLHLFFEEPDIIQKYPEALKKTVLKEKHKYYEVLRDHTVTFTRNVLRRPKGTKDFAELYEKLCKEVKPTVIKEFDYTSIEPEIERFDEIAMYLIQSTSQYTKTVDYFHGDHSALEFGFFAFVYRRLNNLLSTGLFKDTQYDDNQRMWILYLVCKDHLPFPHRKKHDEQRAGMPWLLYLCHEVIAKFNDPDKEEPDT